MLSLDAREGWAFFHFELIEIAMQKSCLARPRLLLPSLSCSCRCSSAAASIGRGLTSSDACAAARSIGHVTRHAWDCWRSRSCTEQKRSECATAKCAVGLQEGKGDVAEDKLALATAESQDDSLRKRPTVGKVPMPPRLPVPPARW